MDDLIMKFANQNPFEARKIFNNLLEKETDKDRITTLEMLREYYCNPEFRKGFEDFTFQINQEIA